MGIRETLNKNPGLTNGVTVGIIAVALAAILWQMHTSHPSGALGQQYYTTDDGATWYLDSMSNIAPYTHDGKEAVIAHLYKCGSGKEFVGYLERLDPAALQQVNAKPGRANDPSFMADVISRSTQVKLPNSASPWVLQSTVDGAKITTVKCPSGSSDSPAAVLPGM